MLFGISVLVRIYDNYYEPDLYNMMMGMPIVLSVFVLCWLFLAQLGSDTSRGSRYPMRNFNLARMITFTLYFS